MLYQLSYASPKSIPAHSGTASPPGILPRRPMICAGTLPHGAYHGTVSKVSIMNQSGQTWSKPRSHPDHKLTNGFECARGTPQKPAQSPSPSPHPSRRFSPKSERHARSKVTGKRSIRDPHPRHCFQSLSRHKNNAFVEPVPADFFMFHQIRRMV